MNRSFKRNVKKYKNKSLKMTQYGGEFNPEMSELDKLNQLQYYGDELIKLDEIYTKVNSAYKKLDKKNETSNEAQKLELYNNYLKKYIDELVKLTKKDIKILTDSAYKFCEIKLNLSENIEENKILFVKDFLIGDLRSYETRLSDSVNIIGPTSSSFQSGNEIPDPLNALIYVLKPGESDISRIEKEFIKKIILSDTNKALYQSRNQSSSNDNFGFVQSNADAARALLGRFKEIRAQFVGAFSNEYTSKITRIEKNLTGDDKDYEEYKNTIKSLKDKYIKIFDNVEQEFKDKDREKNKTVGYEKIKITNNELGQEEKEKITKILKKKAGELESGKLKDVKKVDELIASDKWVEEAIKAAKKKDDSEKDKEENKKILSKDDKEKDKLLKKYGEKNVDKATKLAMDKLDAEAQVINISNLLLYELIPEDKSDDIPLGEFIDYVKPGKPM